MTSTTLQVPGVKNPLCDIPTLPSAYCNASSTGQGAGTTTNTGDSSAIASQQQQQQSCGAGALIGGAIGALGFIAGPVGIGTTALGVLAGCYVTQTFFPAQGSQIYGWTTNNIPAIGDFLKAFTAAMVYASNFLSFVNDVVIYEFALFSAAPEIGLFLLPLQALTAIWMFIEIATFVRGINLGL